MSKTNLEKKVRELGFALGVQDMTRRRTSEYIGQRLLHKLLLDKLYATEKQV